MTIDSRHMQSLLQKQMLPSMDMLSASKPSSAQLSTTSPSVFEEILQQLLEQQSSSSGVLPYEDLLNEVRLLAAGRSGLGIELQTLLNGGELPALPSASADLSGRAAVYRPYIEEAALKHGVDPALIQAVIHTESSFRSEAVSSAGAKGLMQLMDATARGLGVTDSFDPAQNIDGGTRFLAYLLRKYDGNEQVALAAYNAGPGRVDRLGIRTDADVMTRLELLPQETQNYIGKVMNTRNQYI